jgi:HAE1 family hydrophobic/amphiphilic exporter-1
MGLTRLSVHRPVVVLTAYLALVLFGILSYVSLGLEKSPTLKLPIITVQVAYPGASAQTVEEQVTRRVEDAVAGLGNIKTLSSVSRSGRAALTVEFREGVDANVAVSDVQQRVSAVERDLPADAEKPSYLKLDLNDVPILYLAVVGGDGDETALYRVADDLVRPRLETIEDVGRIVVVGGRAPEVQVEILPDRLRAYGYSIADVTAAVKSQFLTVSGGDVKSGSEGGTRRATLSVTSRRADVSALGAIPVTRADGTSTELRNLAAISLGGREATEVVRVNGRPAVGLLVYKQSSANIADTVDRVLPAVEQARRDLPVGYGVEVAVDVSQGVRHTVRGVGDELLLAVVITGLIIFLFLHSLRPTLIVLLSIPSSLLIALIAMKLTGLTLNTMTLIALTTSIGVLVDDSIVVLENITTHLQRGKEPKEAAVDGRSEIGLAAIAITLVDVAVWGPILLMTGLTGAFLKNFSIVMVSATLASLLVSFTLTPLVASRWLAAGEDRSWLARLAAFWEPLYRVTERGYVRLLYWSLRHRPVVVLAALLVFASNLVILPRIGTEYVPEANDDTAVIIAELPAGTALEAAGRAAQRWEAVLMDRERFPEIHAAYLLVGRGELDSDREPRFITLTLDLGEPAGRVRKSKAIAIEAAKAGESVVPGMRTHLGGQRAGSRGQPVQVRIYGDDLAELGRLAALTERTLAGLPELTDVQNSVASTPELTIETDPSRLMDLGISAQAVGTAVRVAYQGAVVGQWADPDGREQDVRVRLPDALRYGPEAVTDLPLARRGPQMVTLSQVATARLVETPTKIDRVNRQRIALVGAEPAGVPLGTATPAVTRAMNGLGLPDGTRWSFAGQGEDQQSSFRQLVLGIAVSIVLMYMVLVVLYESWLQPVLILTALPLASVGAFLGLLVFQRVLSLPAFIGLIALFGLVGKNSILLVDRANDLRRQGLDRTTALERAGPSRLRPIVMTSAVLVFSMLPVALQWSPGGEVRSPVGAILVGGMTTSTFLSLLYVPVMYTYFDSLGSLFGRIGRWHPGRRAARTGAAEETLATPETASPAATLAGEVIRGVVASADNLGTQLLERGSVLDILPRLNPVQRALLRPLATREATKFLRERLGAVEARLAERGAYLDAAYPDAAARPTDDGEAGWVAQREKRVLYELLAACQEELFVDVLRTRLEAGQRRMSELARAEASDVAERGGTTAARERFEVWTEQQILDDVARQWLLWIKKKLPRGIRFD